MWPLGKHWVLQEVERRDAGRRMTLLAPYLKSWTNAVTLTKVHQSHGGVYLRTAGLDAAGLGVDMRGLYLYLVPEDVDTGAHTSH